MKTKMEEAIEKKSSEFKKGELSEEKKIWFKETLLNLLEQGFLDDVITNFKRNDRI